MSKNLTKILAVISATAAVGVMPLLGASIDNKNSTSSADGFSGICSINRNIILDNGVSGISSINVELSNVEVVGSVEQEETITDEDEDPSDFIPIRQTISISGQNNFKSYMSYRAISNSNSIQHRLQALSYTGNYGIRMVGDRYCIAVGTAITTNVGTYVDLVLKNGSVIPCIIGDIKAPCHTKGDNITTASNGCVSEFIIDNNYLDSKIRQSGSVSKCNELWDSPVVQFVVYEKNVFDE